MPTLRSDDVFLMAAEALADMSSLQEIEQVGHWCLLLAAAAAAGGGGDFAPCTASGQTHPWYSRRPPSCYGCAGVPLPSLLRHQERVGQADGRGGRLHGGSAAACMLACCPWLQGGAGGGCVDRQQHQRRRSFAACTCVIATPDNPRPALLPRCRCAAAWAPSPLTLTPCAGRQAWPAPPPTARVGMRTPPPTCSTPTPPTSEQSDGHRRPLIYQPQQPGPGCHAAQAQQHAVTFSPQPALQIRFNSAPAWHATLP